MGGPLVGDNPTNNKYFLMGIISQYPEGCVHYDPKKTYYTRATPVRGEIYDWITKTGGTNPKC